MEIQAVLGIIVALGIVYFMYKKVTAKKDSTGGNGGGLPGNDDNQQER